MKKCMKMAICMTFLLLCIFGNSSALSNLINAADEWEPVNPQTGDVALISVIKAVPGNHQKVFVGYTNGEVYVTDNAIDPSPVWTRIFPLNNCSGEGRMVTGIAVNPYNSLEVYAAFEGDQYGGILLRTEDGGITWQTLTPPSRDICSISIHPLNPDILYLIADRKVFVSINRSVSWTNEIVADPFAVPLSEGDCISTIYQLPYEPQRVFLGTENGMLFTCSNIHAREPYWYEITTRGNPLPESIITSIAIDTDAIIPTLYVTCMHHDNDSKRCDSIWRSLNGGTEWASIHNSSIPAKAELSCVSSNPYNNDILYAGYQPGSAARSMDRGNTWFRHSSGSGKNLKVQYRDGGYQHPFDNHIKPHVRIENLGNVPVPVNELTLRYWHTIDSEQSQEFWVDYAYLGNNIINGSFVFLGPFSFEEADYYLEVSFVSETIYIEGFDSSGEIQLRFNKTDWSEYNENNDFSYTITDSTYKDWGYITLYRAGELIWGNEP